MMIFLAPHSLWETVQTLFWAIFGLVDLDNFELTGIKEFTRFSGLLMFGSFSVINIIVLLNLLIAMMNHSYQLISVSSVSIYVAFKIYDFSVLFRIFSTIHALLELHCIYVCTPRFHRISFLLKFSSTL